MLKLLGQDCAVFMSVSDLNLLMKERSKVGRCYAHAEVIPFCCAAVVVPLNNFIAGETPSKNPTEMRLACYSIV